MHRLRQIIHQLEASPDDNSHLLREQAMADLRIEFAMTTDKMRQFQLYFLEDMLKGLKSNTASTIKQLPSYVRKTDPASISGAYYALDLGGTNFRVMELVLERGQVVSTKTKAFQIPKEHMQGTAEGLFGFITDSVSNTLAKGAEGDLGFTFSFPTTQSKINEATLITWTKGFSTKGVEGKDVCALLQKSFDKTGVKLRIAAACNDTVGTLVTQYFQDASAAVGVIIGTGFNCAYWEKVNEIKKMNGSGAAPPSDIMALNMECGNFDSYSTPRCLPFTHYDATIDARSPNPGAQYTEKLISGMYLGAVCREVFLALIAKGALCPLPSLVQRGFQTWQMSFCLGDNSEGLSEIEAHLEKEYGATSTELDRTMIREVCWLVANRSARVAVSAISTIACKMGVSRACTVSVDGSVFEKVPGYKQLMEVALRELNDGDPHHHVKFALTKEGSGVGAGLIAALAVAAD